MATRIRLCADDDPSIILTAYAKGGQTTFWKRQLTDLYCNNAIFARIAVADRASEAQTSRMDAMTAFQHVPMLQRVFNGIRAALNGDLAGLYLYGSVVSGDFIPGISDLDLLAVTWQDIGPADLEPLEAMHAAVVRDDPEWENRIEVAYLAAEGLRTFKTQ